MNQELDLLFWVKATSEEKHVSESDHLCGKELPAEKIYWHPLQCESWLMDTSYDIEFKD